MKNSGFVLTALHFLCNLRIGPTIKSVTLN